MGFRRYVAPTAREALERIRKELGVDAVILSNRRAGPKLVEIIAAASGQMRALVEDLETTDPAATVAQPSVARKSPSPVVPLGAKRAPPESFQQFIRRQTGPADVRRDAMAMYEDIAAEQDAAPAPPAGAASGTRRGNSRLDAAMDQDPPAVFRRRPTRLQSGAHAADPQDSGARPDAPPPVIAPRPATVVVPRAAERPAAPAAAGFGAAGAPASPAAPIMHAAPPVAAAAPLQPGAPSVQSLVPATAATPAPAAPTVQIAAAVPAAPPVKIVATVPAVALAPAPALAVAPPVPASDPTPQAPAALPPPFDRAMGVLQGKAALAALPDSRLMAELQSLRSTLSDRISNLEDRLAAKAPAPGPVPAAPAPAAAAAPAPARPPARQQVMTRLIMSGFSPELARRVGDAAPATLEPKDTDVWLQRVIGQYVRCPADVDNPLMTPGAVALVGPTGVGKTTTIAKIAARFVVRHGAGALGLITLDAYRMGAHEQLRGYGRILGVPVHTAHDAASLRELLASMHGRRQVLIDTCGMSQRDPRLAEMLGMLDSVRFGEQPVRRVLLVNAASHAETLDEVARAWRVDNAHGAILTKIDEAARIGGALDAMMRFQTPLLGLTNGQRVPEDWHPGNPPLLAHIALKPFGAAFSLDSEDLQALSRSGALLA